VHGALLTDGGFTDHVDRSGARAPAALRVS
jgi:hypothetical protein